MAFIIWALLCIGSGSIIIDVYRLTRLNRSVKICLVPIFLAVVVSPLYYEYPNYGFSKVVTFDGDKVIEHPFGTFVPEFSNDYSNVTTSDTLITSGVTSVTENPKVRHLQYAVNALIVNVEMFYREKHRRHTSASDGQSGDGTFATKTLTAGTCNTVREEIVDLVAYQLIEFNNRFSKQLAQFYNPLDQRQQQEFRTLLKSYVNAELAKDGIMVEVGNFKIE